MILDRVTITGADDSINPNTLCELSAKFPFVEWGILFSQHHQGHKRFPSVLWVQELLKVAPASMHLSAHLCGRWVRDLFLDGRYTWAEGRIYDTARFQRVQLNFHGELQNPDVDRALERTGRQFIFQHDGVNDQHVREWVKAGFGVPLFDTSGGAGVLPLLWPTAWKGVYCGYAGGLGPENVTDEVCGPILGAADNERIWIDMERRVRSEDDSEFLITKVRNVLLQMEPQITSGASDADASGSGRRSPAAHA